MKEGKGGGAEGSLRGWGYAFTYTKRVQYQFRLQLVDLEHASKKIVPASRNRFCQVNNPRGKQRGLAQSNFGN